MQVFTRDGTPVEIEVGGDGPDDLQIISATITDSGEQLPESELSWIERNFQEQMYLDWVDSQIMRAEYLSEGMER